ncbi:MAG: hypothetical protein ACI4O0_06195 [Candidatus Limivicinus sp.]
MKKIIAAALMLTLILCLAACGSAQPEVTIVPTEAPAATAAPAVEPTAEPTPEPTPQPETPETEEQILNNFLEDFTRAYFYGTAEDVRSYLAADFQGPVDAYQGGEPSGIETRLLFPQENDPSRYVASIQFVAGDEDSYTYLSLDLVNTDEGWKVAFYGLEK